MQVEVVVLLGGNRRSATMGREVGGFQHTVIWHTLGDTLEKGHPVMKYVDCGGGLAYSFFGAGEAMKRGGWTVTVAALCLAMAGCGSKPKEAAIRYQYPRQKIVVLKGIKAQERFLLQHFNPPWELQRWEDDGEPPIFWSGGGYREYYFFDEPAAHTPMTPTAQWQQSSLEISVNWNPSVWPGGPITGKPVTVRYWEQ